MQRKDSHSEQFQAKKNKTRVSRLHFLETLYLYVNLIDEDGQCESVHRHCKL